MRPAEQPDEVAAPGPAAAAAARRATAAARQRTTTTRRFENSMAGWSERGGVRWCSRAGGPVGAAEAGVRQADGGPGDDVQDHEAERHLGDAEKSPGSERWGAPG